jgi:hypothetical protein
MLKLFECEHKLINKQYLRCIIIIVRYDYPFKWTNLVHTIKDALNSFPNEKGVVTGLQALHGLVKKYEYESDADREPLYAIFDQILDNLGNLVNSLIDPASQGNDSALKILYYIIKIVFTGN